MGTVTVQGRDELGRLIDVTLTTSNDAEPPGPETVAPGGGDGGDGVSVLEDPGNVWTPNTVVVEGYRIAAERAEWGDTIRVFEVSTAGTTYDGIGFAEGGISADITPLGETTESDGVHWSYLGIVGELPWTSVPLVDGIGVTMDFSRRLAQIASNKQFDDSALMFQLLAALENGQPDTEHPIFENRTDGDADWNLDQNTGAGFRFNQSADGVLLDDAGRTQITTEGFRVSIPPSTRFEVVYDPFTVYLVGLPTADPSNAGQLYTDGVPSAGTPKALMVSGG